MAPKFQAMSKAEVLGLVEEVRKSLTTITAAELAALDKAEGIKDSPERASGIKPGKSMKKEETNGSPEGSSSMVKDDLPPEGSVSSASGSPSASPEGSSSSGSAEAPPVDGPPVDGAPPAGPEGSAPPVAAGPEGSAPPPAGPEGSMPPPAGPEGAPPAGPSMEELVGLYMALPEQDFEMHAAAFQQAAAERQGAGAPGHAPASPGPSAAPVAPSPSPSAPPAFKSEKVEELEASLKKTQAELAQVAEAFETLLTIPQRKAHTGIEYIQMQPVKKSEPGAKKDFKSLTKAELHQALKVMTGPESKLSKSERNLVTSYLVGTVEVAALEPIYNKS